MALAKRLAMAVGRDLAISLSLGTPIQLWQLLFTPLEIEVMGPRLPHECELFVPRLRSYVLRVLGDR